MSRSERPSELVLQAGLRLRAARQALNLSQEVLSREIGATRTALANWENGERLADVVAMTRLLSRFGIPLEWIYAGRLAQLPYDLAQAIEREAISLGAVIGGAIAEWPMQVRDRLPAARKRRLPRGHGTLHDTRAEFGGR